MDDLIRIREKNGKLITTSLNVAHVFGKSHDHVLRDIENLDCSDEFRETNFGLSSYTNELSNAPGREYKKYEIEKDGFSFLVMGYNGEKAAYFKEQYILMYNRMEEQLKKMMYPSEMSKLDWIEVARQQEIEKVALKGKNLQLEHKIEEDKPKVEFVERIKSSEDLLTVGEVAKILKKTHPEIGPNKLFKILKEKEGPLYLLIDTNTPTQYALDNGWIELDPYEYEDSKGKIRLYNKVKVTVKGFIHIDKILVKIYADRKAREDFFKNHPPEK